MQIKLSQKRIPTFLGIGVLVVALVVSVVMLKYGGGVFNPRATAQTTPKKITVSNVKDTSFTVSFLTDESTVGFIKYGTDPRALKLQSSDDRDQLSGSVSPYTTHYVTVRDLTPGTTYYYTLGTGSNSSFDNGGTPYTLKTTPRGGTPAAAKTAYGNVTDAKNAPASGAIVYVSIDGVGELSALVKDSGSWAIPLSNARTADGSNFATIADTSIMNISVQGVTVDSTATLQVTVSNSQPVATIVLGSGALADQNGVGAGGTASSAASIAPFPLATVVPVSSGSAGIAGTVLFGEGVTTNPASNSANPLLLASGSGSLSAGTGLGALTASPAATTVDVKSETHQTVQTTQPTITGVAPANVKLTIQIHSTNPITTQVQADNSGSYSVDLAALQKNLAPGEHTVTVSYVDPQTGKTVTETKTFTVAAPSPSPSSALLADSSSNTSVNNGTNTSGADTSNPFGTSNPFPIDSSTSTDSSTTRVFHPATGSGIPTSGSTSTTLLLVFSGLFFIGAGVWSYLAGRVGVVENENSEFDGPLEEFEA